MKTLKILSISGLLLLSATALNAHSISAVIDADFYGYNTEYANQWRKGTTHFGNAVSAYLSSESYERLKLDAGVFLNYYYGSDNPPTEVWPFLRVKFFMEEKFSFSMGSFDTKDRHGMPDIILMRERDFHHQMRWHSDATNDYYGMLYGMKLTFSNRIISYKSWLNWDDLLNDERREFLAYGNNLEAGFDFGLRLYLKTYVSHHGGQGGPGVVRDNWILSAGAAYEHRLFGIKAHFFGDRDTPDRSDDSLDSTGAGVLAEVYFKPLPILKLYTKFWRGENFISEEGNPMYRTDKPFFMFGGKLNTAILGNPQSRFWAELRGHVIERETTKLLDDGREVNYLAKYIWGLGFSHKMDFFIHDFSEKAEVPTQGSAREH